MQHVNERHSFNSELNKLEREVCLTLPNPEYNEVLKKYPHLREVHMNDTDEKEQLPVHIVLGASNFARIQIEKNSTSRKNR